MTVFVLSAIIILLLGANIVLWKFGFVHEAQAPPLSEDKPVMNAKERKAVVKHLTRWREEGKLTREEFDRLTALCESDW